MIVYGKWKYPDIANLAKKNPAYIRHALALNIRYSYLNLNNHGLARNYVDFHLTPQQATEGFASSFNHYFDNYYSAFPDLESVFGSRGSFFQVKSPTQFTTSIVMVNPPFDVGIMDETLKRVRNWVASGDCNHKYILTLPNWTDYVSLNEAKSDPNTQQVTVYPKGDLPFIDYMNHNMIIYPVEICELQIQYTPELYFTHLQRGDNNECVITGRVSAFEHSISYKYSSSDDNQRKNEIITLILQWVNQNYSTCKVKIFISAPYRFDLSTLSITADLTYLLPMVTAVL